MVLSPKALRVIKPEIRVLGVDDGKFVPHSKSRVLVVGVVFRAGYWLEGVMSTQVEVDGFDATANLVSMIKESPHYRQLRVIMVNGITLGGFNVVDIKKLNVETGLPVIAVTSRKPDLANVRSALKNLTNSEERWNAILNAGEIFPVVTRGGKQAGLRRNCGDLKGSCSGNSSFNGNKKQNPRTSASCAFSSVWNKPIKETRGEILPQNPLFL